VPGALCSGKVAVPKKTLLEYRSLRIEALKKVYNIFKCCFGEKHVITQRALQTFQRSKEIVM
jgi:hypothetical protein